MLHYLKPVHDEIVDSPSIITYNSIVDTIYKLLLASKYKAEADVSDAGYIGYYIEMLKEQVNDDEAKFRLDQLFGIYSNYSNPLKIEAFTIFPNISTPSIYNKISDFLDEAEITRLSRNRYLLGIPSKAKITYVKMKKWKRNLSFEKKYDRYIRGATELIQIVGTTQGIPTPNIDHFKDISVTEYNPPLVNLDYYRVQICKKISPLSTPNFMLPDGATRAISDEYFIKYQEDF